MTSESLVPVRQGRYAKITEPNNGKFFKFGIYRCFVKLKENEPYKHVFQLKKSGYYTHIDLNLAIELGYEIILNNDVEQNALIYDDSSLVKMKYLFRKYEQYLFELKSNKIAKSMMSRLYGALSEKNYKYKFGKVLKENENETCDIIELGDAKLLEFIPTIKDLEVEKINVKFVRKSDFFKHSNMARISPFLTALTRKAMSNTIQKIPLENIVRIHTDSIAVIGRNDMLDKQLGNRMGQFRLKKVDAKLVIHSQNDFEYS